MANLLDPYGSATGSGVLNSIANPAASNALGGGYGQLAMMLMLMRALGGPNAAAHAIPGAIRTTMPMLRAGPTGDPINRQSSTNGYNIFDPTGLVGWTADANATLKPGQYIRPASDFAAART